MREVIGDCVLWTGRVNNNGYGIRGQKTLAHREAFESAYGPIPTGLVIDHLCRNKLCINPQHLEAVTIWENTHGRGISAQGQQTHCRNGHPFDERNTRFLPDGKRVCRTCSRINSLRYYHTHRSPSGAPNVTLSKDS